MSGPPTADWDTAPHMMTAQHALTSLVLLLDRCKLDVAQIHKSKLLELFSACRMQAPAGMASMIYRAQLHAGLVQALTSWALHASSASGSKRQQALKALQGPLLLALQVRCSRQPCAAGCRCSGRHQL
jgi:hypothetical protein